ncbi:hypothetical protein DYY67_0744 [Candidatus Nitrosotalea sp. TS]|uniref:hypothetical protein n=1 Tax=Candidatus Nitrosotalea sp. TS TaxID=2341020 RepID=UPI00140C3852|nr:hypothetical protein [Candidatus Nitrosotalea sp. TS]NHI02840.1 hypothetical protein [Candidatus Nitrosotalea sp. TS]
MKSLYLLVTAFLLIVLLAFNTAFAQNVTNSSNFISPIAITQVELNDPFKILPDDTTCEDAGVGEGCAVNLVPNHKVACGHYIGSGSCEPIHVENNLTNPCVIASGFHADGAPVQDVHTKYGEQWITLYNRLDTPITASHFEIYAYKEGWQSDYSGPALPYHVANPPSIAPYLIMLPHQSCTYGFMAIDEPLSLNTENTTLTAVYQYNGTQYISQTPALTDICNDSRTWQFDGNKWVFAEQNTVPIPEFSFAVPILLIGITSMIIFYRIRFRQ